MYLKQSLAHYFGHWFRTNNINNIKYMNDNDSSNNNSNDDCK